MRLRQGDSTPRLEERGGMKRNRGRKKEFILSATRWGNGIRKTSGRSFGIFSILELTKEKAFASFHFQTGRRATSGSISRRKIFRLCLSISRKSAKWRCETARSY